MANKIRELLRRIATENPEWGYTKIHDLGSGSSGATG